MLKLAFGDELRFGTPRSAIDSISKLSQDNPAFTAYYNAADYKNDGGRETLFVKIVNTNTEETHSNMGWSQPLKLKLVVEKIDTAK